MFGSKIWQHRQEKDEHCLKISRIYVRQLISVKDISIDKTSCWIYVTYIAEVLKTRSNLAAKSKGGLRHGLSHASLTSMRC